MFGSKNAGADIQEDEKGYREFYFEADVKQSKLALVLFTVPIAGFFFNDYLFFGLSNVFYELISLRLALLTLIILEFFYVGKVKSYKTYDKIIFGGSLAIAIGGGIINITRPSNYALASILTIISVFVIYLVVPLKFKLQLILSTIISVGEVLIVLALSKNVEVSADFTLVFSMIVANLIAIFSARQVHIYRKRTYREFVKRKALEEELEQHANQLSELVAKRTKDLVEAQSRLVKSERFAAIGELAGMVGHDLRNPLAAIKNASYFLRKKEVSLDEHSAEMLNAIDRSVEYSDKIIRDLLDYSREIRLDLGEYSPKSLVNYAILDVTVPGNIKITQDTQGEPAIWVDANRIERVFINLIKNAFDAMPNGGKLRISTRQDGSNVEFVFADTGSGIPESIIGKVFTPLFTTKAQGMGFGLAICKRFVEAHGGKICVESANGEGAKFIVSLPIDLNQGLNQAK